MQTGPSLEEQRQFYNDRWRGAEYINGPKFQRALAILREVEALKLCEPRVLELGCGTGWLTAMLGTLGPAVGVDLSDAAIAEASARYPSARFVAADALTWDHPGDAFDLVVSHEVLEHTDDQATYLRVAHRLLKQGGHLILTTPNRSGQSEGAFDDYDGQPIEKWLTRRELKGLLAPSFQVVRLTSIRPGIGTRGAYRIICSSRLRRLLRRVGLCDAFDAVALCLGFGHHHLVVARKL